VPEELAMQANITVEGGVVILKIGNVSRAFRRHFPRSRGFYVSARSAPYRGRETVLRCSFVRSRTPMLRGLSYVETLGIPSPGVAGELQVLRHDVRHSNYAEYLARHLAMVISKINICWRDQRFGKIGLRAVE
jgi:hypothetical protein